MEEQEQPEGHQQINIEVQNGQDFFADQVSVSHNPLRFILDFTRTTPRIDGNATSQPRLVMSHNLVMIDPYLAVEFINVLKDNIAKFEKRHGKIARPGALKKLDEEARKAGKVDAKKQEYFG